MPAEERKFSRRRIVAFPPTCNRDRANAASHTSALGGVSTTGVAVTSRTGVSVGDGTIVGGAVVCVAVKGGVAVRSIAVAVPFCGEIGDEVNVSALDVDESFVVVKLGDCKGNEVDVDESDGGVAVGDCIGGEIVAVTG